MNPVLIARPVELAVSNPDRELKVSRKAQPRPKARIEVPRLSVKMDSC